LTAGSAYGQRLSASREIDRSKSGRKSNYSESSSGISPDLAPSDFYLFGALKVQLSGCILNHPMNWPTRDARSRVSFHGRHLRCYFWNGKKDWSDLLALLVPVLTKVYNGTICPVRLLRSVLMLGTYRTPYIHQWLMSRSTK
jgi:hypothetical protein